MHVTKITRFDWSTVFSADVIMFVVKVSCTRNLHEFNFHQILDARNLSPPNTTSRHYLDVIAGIKVELLQIVVML